MSIYEKYVPSLIVDGKAVVDSVNSPLVDKQQVGGNLENILNPNNMLSQINVVLEFDKAHAVPFFYMKKNARGRISLYMAVPMKQTRFNSSGTGLETNTVWVVTSASSDSYTRNMSTRRAVNTENNASSTDGSTNNGSTVQREAYGNGNPFYLLYGLNQHTVNGATVTGTLSTLDLPTKMSNYFNGEYVNPVTKVNTGKTVSSVLNHITISLWLQLNKLLNTEDEIDVDNVQNVWNKYQSALDTFKQEGHIASTVALYATDNQVYIGNMPFYSKNLSNPHLDAKTFIGKEHSQVTTLPTTKVVMAVNIASHDVETNNFDYGLYQLEGISQERIVLDDEEVAKVTPESFTGRVMMNDGIGNEVYLNVRITEQSYGRKGQRINKVARNFSKISLGSEVLVTGDLIFTPDPINGTGVIATIVLDNYRFINNYKDSTLDLGSTVDGYDFDDLLGGTPIDDAPINGVLNSNSVDDNQVQVKNMSQSDDEMNS